MQATPPNQHHWLEYLLTFALLWVCAYFIRNFAVIELTNMQQVVASWFIVALVFCAGLYIAEKPKK